uniref:SGL domain-containing protein n=1 Tax=Caenorhabditis tropicalis TaxID=1561998 RepID=A0A1I7V2J0_9PELO
MYDLTKRSYKAEEIPVVGLEDAEFLPHGISHWVLKDGTIRLFLVVHSKNFEHSIVILDFDEKKKQLNHVRTLRDPKFYRPNDILASGENSFLISNDGGACDWKIANVLEIATGFHQGSLVHFDGKNAKYLLEKTATNGIILSQDKKTLFVSFIYHETIGVFDWNERKQEIRKVSEIETQSACDNFHIDEEDNLWSACHPVLKEAAVHLGDPHNPALHSPTQVLRFKFSPDRKTAETVEVFSDDGRFTSAGAVAANFDKGRQMLIGTVFRGVTHCDIDILLDF